MDPLLLYFFTVIASTEGFVAGVALLLILLVLRHKIEAASYLAACAAGLIIAVNVLKETFQVPRPVEALIETTGYAFPSGHAAGSCFLAAVVIVLVRRHARVVRIPITVFVSVLALAICWSRIELRVHTFEQVLAGAAVGVAFALVFALSARMR